MSVAIASRLLVVGLGNRGMDGTRHNLGSMIVQRVALRTRAVFRDQPNFRAKIATVPLTGASDGRQVHLMLPETNMNASGEAVGLYARYYKIAPLDVVVVVDDMAYQVGDFRLQPSGGAGGHNGLADIERHLGSREYIRLRAGIGRAPYSFEDHVLGRFTAQELELLPVDRAADALIELMSGEFAQVATKYNTKREQV